MQVPSCHQAQPSMRVIISALSNFSVRKRCRRAAGSLGVELLRLRTILCQLPHKASPTRKKNFFCRPHSGHSLAGRRLAQGAFLPSPIGGDVDLLFHLQLRFSCHFVCTMMTAVFPSNVVRNNTMMRRRSSEACVGSLLDGQPSVHGCAEQSGYSQEETLEEPLLKSGF